MGLWVYGVYRVYRVYGVYWVYGVYRVYRVYWGCSGLRVSDLGSLGPRLLHQGKACPSLAEDDWTPKTGEP